MLLYPCPTYKTHFKERFQLFWKSLRPLLVPPFGKTPLTVYVSTMAL